MTAPDPVLFPIPYIRHIVGQEFSVPPGWLVGGRMEHDVVEARRAAILVTVLSTSLSGARIAKAFYVDPSSVRNAAVKGVELMKSDLAYCMRIDKLVRKAKAKLPKHATSRRRNQQRRRQAVCPETIEQRWGNGVANRDQRAQKKRATESLTLPIAQH